jgi:hypothetical protein
LLVMRERGWRGDELTCRIYPILVDRRTFSVPCPLSTSNKEKPTHPSAHLQHTSPDTKSIQQPRTSHAKRSLTSQNTRIEPRKTMVQQLFAQIIIKRLLRAILRLVSGTGTPIGPVKAERHGAALRRALGVLRRRGFRGVNEGLVPGHPNEWLGAPGEFCGC